MEFSFDGLEEDTSYVLGFDQNCFLIPIPIEEESEDADFSGIDQYLQNQAKRYGSTTSD